ncbi:MAG: hypothetical protein Q4E70_00440 [Candidatus Saccharibacteria bacterium]|nr:hypothetical protein [Candidatus Saccharibacteria bacterium]
MVILGALIILFILFFVLKKHVGPAHLAVIVGVTVYDTFGTDVVNGLMNMINGAPKDLLKVVVFLILVLGLPLLLYFRSSRGGLFGILRIIEALLFSSLLVSLCAWCINYFAPFDGLGKNIVDFITKYKGIIMLAGVLSAYFDILFYREV